MNNCKLTMQFVSHLKRIKIKIPLSYRVKQNIRGIKELQAIIEKSWKYLGLLNSVDFVSLIIIEKYVKRKFSRFGYIQIKT